MLSSRISSQAGLRVTLCALALVFASAGEVASDPIPSSGKPAAYPDWWFTRSVIKRINPALTSPVWPADYPQADDFAVLNQGQLKQLATADYDELQASLAGGAGNEALALVKSWYQPEANGNLPPPAARVPKTTGVDNFAVVNLGQLKNVAKPFYDQFITLGYCPGYLWSYSAAGSADDTAVVNLGQVKNLFRFLPNNWLDANENGIVDWFEATLGRTDSDGSGLPDSVKIVLGLNPAVSTILTRIPMAMG